MNLLGKIVCLGFWDWTPLLGLTTLTHNFFDHCMVDHCTDFESIKCPSRMTSALAIGRYAFVSFKPISIDDEMPPS